MARRVEQIAAILDRRQPPSASGWEQRRAWTYDGPKIYLIVDDLDSIPARQQIHEQVQARCPPGGRRCPLLHEW